MSGSPKKRLSSDNSGPENIKHMKRNHNTKENIPPDYSGTVTSSNSFTCLTIGKPEITTPKKSREHLKEQPVTPSTNFKLLATIAADQDYAECGLSNSKDDVKFEPMSYSADPTDSETCKSNKNQETLEQISSDFDMTDSTGKVNRKEKSLAIICTRFLSMYPSYPNPKAKIIVSLDEACLKLGVERRRLYDIINVFESIDLLQKNAKNQYLWFGRNNLEKALCKLKATAEKENMLEKLQFALKSDVANCKQSCILNEVQIFNETCNKLDTPVSPIPAADLRKEKSLGVMSQKFLMLFLVYPDQIISLGVAAKVLNGFLQKTERAAQIKTQIRRLYDVANVLSSIGLIKKETAFSHCGRKPAFKYIGPDLRNIKDDSFNFSAKTSSSPPKSTKSLSLTRHSSFNEICAVAEMERQKLNSQTSHNSAPPFEHAIIGEKEKGKTSFENLQLNKETKIKVSQKTNVVESKPTANNTTRQIPKLLNLRKPTNSTVPCYVLSNVSIDKSETKITNPYGTQTLFLINTIAPPKEIKAESAMKPPVNILQQVPQQQIIKLSFEQRDAILQSLNISLSPQQIASIHLDGSAHSSSPNAHCNILKIMNKTSTKISEDNKNIMKILPLREIDSNRESTVNNTRSNTPSSTQTSNSPLTIPSGYATPIPNMSSDLSFISNTEVCDILKNIENQSIPDISSSKVNVSSHDMAVAEATKLNNGTTSEVHGSSQHQNINARLKPVSSNNLNSKNDCSTNHGNHLISNESCSNDSANLEVTNILKGKSLGDSGPSAKSFLIDEKTILSPIKATTPSQILVPSTLVNLPCIVSDSIFVLNPPTNFQTAKVTNNSSILTVVPSVLHENKKK